MPYHFADWLIEPQLNQLRRGSDVRALEPLAMNVLCHLLEHAGQVVSTDELLDCLWARGHGAPENVARCVNQLRRALGDDARQPRYVETIRKRGYRVIAPVSSLYGNDAAENLRNGAGAPLSAVAVIPFDDLSPDGHQAWLIDGLAEELVESLSRIEDVFVPPRVSTRTVTDQKPDLAEIAGQLGVGTFVTGSVRCTTDRVNVTVQWIRIHDLSHLWSARYVRSLEDLLAVQHEIAIGIAEAIRDQLGIHDTTTFLLRERYRTSDVRAWTLFRQGYDLLNTFTPENLSAGRALIQQAIDIDPEYAEALAALAWSDFDHPERRIEGARRVLELDPTNPTAYHTLIDDSITCWDFATAERMWDRASAANPRANVLTIMGFHIYHCTGRLREALEVAQRAVHIDPLWNVHQQFLGVALLCLGDYAGAIPALEKALDLILQADSTPNRRATLAAPAGSLRQTCDALSIAYWHAGRQADTLEIMVQGYPEQEHELRRGWRENGWQGANMALAESLIVTESPFAPMTGTAKYLIDWRRARCLGLAGQAEPVYDYLERLMQETRVVRVRDREAYRKVCILASALNAAIEFTQCCSFPQFRDLKHRVDQRMNSAAGTYEHLP